MQWLKERVKEDVIGVLILAFLLGSGFIFFADHFSSFQLSDGEKVNGAVLWLTSLAIFWYAYETYQLKKSTTDQVNLQEEIMLNEFLPILEPIAKGAAVIKSGNFTKFCIRNLGKGPAKYITLSVGSLRIVVDFSLASLEEEPIIIDAQAQAALKKLLLPNPETLKLKLQYEDIYGRTFCTDKIVLRRSEKQASYELKKGAWDFVSQAAKKELR